MIPCDAVALVDASVDASHRKGTARTDVPHSSGRTASLITSAVPTADRAPFGYIELDVVGPNLRRAVASAPTPVGHLGDSLATDSLSRTWNAGLRGTARTPRAGYGPRRRSPLRRRAAGPRTVPGTTGHRGWERACR